MFSLICLKENQSVFPVLKHTSPRLRRVIVFSPHSVAVETLQVRATERLHALHSQPLLGLAPHLGDTCRVAFPRSFFLSFPK